MTRLTVFGLKNCDTCRKARRWLDDNGIDHRFVDVRVGETQACEIAQWEKSVGWETLLNRRGTTWRGLADAERDIRDAAGAVALMARFPALIKRPVFVRSDLVHVGFTETVKAALAAG